jgi:hypothetical protein
VFVGVCVGVRVAVAVVVGVLVTVGVLVGVLVDVAVTVGVLVGAAVDTLRHTASPLAPARVVDGSRKITFKYETVAGAVAESV